MRCFFQACATVLALSGAAAAPAAETYPSRPVRMIVPFPPGGAADLIGRVLAQQLSTQLGQQLVVENRPGASGNIGAEAVAKAPADGYTLLLGALTSHSINYTLERKVLRYDLLRDLAPIASVASVPYVFVVHPSVPAHSLREFIAHAGAKQISYGSSGGGAPQRLAAEMLKQRTGIDLLHVPYKGSGEVITALLGGHILVAFESAPAVLPHVQAGKLRALAVTTARRVALLPDVPTTAEAGLPDFEISSTFGILAPDGTPVPVIQRLNRELTSALEVPDVKEKLRQQGADTVSTTPEQAGERLRAEVAMWARAIRDANIKPD
jgi:tripartite-type tricarboxylate transporter receptor subunit TctC